MNKVSKTYETTLSIPMCVTRDQKEKREKQRQKKRFGETMANLPNLMQKVNLDSQ